MKLTLFIIPLFVLTFLNEKLFPQSGWQQLNSGTNAHLLSVYFITPSTGFCSGINTFLKTTDGGSTWISKPTFYDLYKIQFANENTGISYGPHFVIKTTNSGDNWNKIYEDTSNIISDISLVNSDQYFISGYLGYAYKTTNGGSNWVPIYAPSPYHLRSIYFSSPDIGFLGSISYGIIYKTVNGGANYTASYLNFNPAYSKPIYDIAFTSVNTGYGLSDSGLIIKTTNAGDNWSLMQTGYITNFMECGFATDNTGYILTYGYPHPSTIIKTTDGGQNWIEIFSLTNNGHGGSIFFTDQNTGYYCGRDGLIYKTTTGGVIGVQQISTEIPRNFNLYQNYPNPFNPTTVIKFDLAKENHVKLSLYDANGNSLLTIADNYLKAGTYEYNLNASEFSSGVYFYKLEAGKFSAAKKLVLLK